MQLEKIKEALQNGLLCFPVTDIDDQGVVALESYGQRVDWLLGHRPSAVFVAGGTGEFFSLNAAEYQSVVEVACTQVDGRVPVIASAGRSVSDAIAHASVAATAGADALLLMPPYLTSCPPSGLVAYVEEILHNTDLPVIYYNRANGILDESHLQTLAERCPNLIGVKDGTSNMQQLNLLIRTLGDRLTYIGGAPTAEIVAAAYLSIGVNTYSSAVFNFVPELATLFYEHLRAGRQEIVHQILQSFFVPFVQLRDTTKGYGVSLIKAGASLVGHPAGDVRPPLIMPDGREQELLKELIQKAHSLSAQLSKTETT